MSSSSKNQSTRPRESARERLAAQRRAEEERRKRNRMIGVGALAVALILAIIGIMAVVNGSRKNDTSQASGDYVTTLTSVPAATLDAVGAGSIERDPSQAVADAQPFQKDGKPRYLYVGTEFCPFCGMERWPLTIAMSRFGTFEGLKASRTPANEGNVPTLTYKDAKYTSQYIAFDPFETADANGQPLQKLSDADTAIHKKIDPDQHVPFSYWGTRSLVGASYQAPFLQNADPNAVAKKLADPTSAEAKAILGAANVHTAQICKLTGNKPADVCSAAGVQAAAKVLS